MVLCSTVVIRLKFPPLISLPFCKVISCNDQVKPFLMINRRKTLIMMLILDLFGKLSDFRDISFYRTFCTIYTSDVSIAS